MSKFGKNTISNIITKIWSMVSIYFFIPLYIQILGETSYGLVSFFTTLQSALQLLGLGLSNTLRREFAISNEGENSKNKKYLLLRSVENIYFLIGALIICVCCFGANTIATYWLNTESLDSKVVSMVIRLMGVSIAIQMIANLYIGCLFGLDRQVIANICTVLWSMGKSIGSLLIIRFIKPSLVLFYGWHIIIDIIYLLFVRFLVIENLKLDKKTKWSVKDLSNLQTIWNYAMGILLISIIALINKQLDKIIISKYLTISELGAYNTATTLGGVTGIISSAVFTSIFPRFTKKATSGNQEEIISNFKIVNKIVNVFLSSMGCFISVYSLPLIRLWTKSEYYVEVLGYAGLLVVLAVTMIEFQQIPYAFALAHGNTKINTIVGISFIPIEAIATLYFIKNYGLIGAGTIHFIMMTGQTLIYEYLVYKTYISKKSIKMIITDTIVPIVLSFLSAVISRTIINRITDNILIICLFGIIVGGITALMLLLTYSNREVKLFVSLKED